MERETKLISWKYYLFYKRLNIVVIAINFLVLEGLALYGVLIFPGPYSWPPIALLVPPVLAALALYTARSEKLYNFDWILRERFTFADEVYLGDDYLIVRYQGREETVKISSIENVVAPTFLYYGNCRVYLKEPSMLGKKFAFIGATSWMPGKIHPDTQAFIDKIWEMRGYPGTVAC